MSEFRLAPEVEAELDAIWLHIARESGDIDVATRLVDSITDRFWLLARYPYMGRARDDDLRPGLCSFTAGNYVMIYRVERDEIGAMKTRCSLPRSPNYPGVRPTALHPKRRSRTCTKPLNYGLTLRGSSEIPCRHLRANALCSLSVPDGDLLRF
jgi:plasmid stabilization system protein ParE